MVSPRRYAAARRQEVVAAGDYRKAQVENLNNRESSSRLRKWYAALEIRGNHPLNFDLRVVVSVRQQN